MVLENVNSYKVIALLDKRYEKFMKHKLVHYVYVKEFIPKNQNVDAASFVKDRTLVAVNVPRNASKEELLIMFQSFGDIQYIDVKYASNDTMSTIVYVVYQAKSGLKKVLSQKQLELAAEDKSFGLSAYKQEYSMGRPEISALEEEANSFMEAFNQREEEERQQRYVASQGVDEDGFQLVTNVASKKRQAEVVTTEVRKKKKAKELQNFYRFQVREKKRGDLQVLRQKFQQDKDKVAKMKAAKLFRPEM